jgi:hypothetical protein
MTPSFVASAMARGMLAAEVLPTVSICCCRTPGSAR